MRNWNLKFKITLNPSLKKAGGIRNFFINPPNPLSQWGTNWKKQSGFALIEVIVSIVILSLVLVAAVGLLYSVGQAVETNRDRLTATYLAQECLELVRNARDTSWKNYEPWNCAWENTNTTCTGKNIVELIKQDSVTINEQETKFSRDFQIESVGNVLQAQRSRTLSILQNPAINSEAEEVKVTCKVSWGENSQLSISEILTNWRKR